MRRLLSLFACCLLSAPVCAEGGNQVITLTDGVTVFPRIAALLEDVLAHAHGQGYVHISYWHCNPDQNLRRGLTFGRLLTRVAEAGNEVCLTLWDPSFGARLGDFDYVRRDNHRCQLLSPKIRVKLLTHPDYDGCYHTKSLLFNNGQQVTALVGGLNMEEESSLGPPHLGDNDWHDTALEIRGPATRAIEDQFARNWSSADLKGPTPTIDYPQDQSVQIALTQPPPPLPPINVRIASLNRPETPGDWIEEETPTLMQIKDELLKRVRAAQSSVYLENYAIHDPELITAIGQNILEKTRLGQPFTTIILIPRPTEEINGWLHRVTFLHLALMGCREFSYQDSGGLHRVLHRPADSWEFHYEGDWYEKSFLQWDRGSTSIKNIREVVGTTPFYTLTALEGRAFKRIQIHSKACLFDDDEAAIGSANFNPRSLRLDGEMTVFFRGSSAQSFRSQLWSEYFSGPGLTPPAQASQWPAAANASLRALHAHARPRTLYAIPLQLKDFPVTHEPDLDPQETLIMKASLY